MDINTGGRKKCPFNLNLTAKITQIKLILTSPQKYIVFPKVKRVSLSASITLEAALAIPMFVFAFIIMSYILMLINFQSRVNQALYNTARSIAKYSYAYEAGELMDTAAAGALVVSEIGVDKINQIGVVGGVAGFTFLLSDFSGDIVDVTVNYTVQLPFDMLGRFYVHCTQRARTRAFTGTEPAEGGNENVVRTYVYVTENGKVYHNDINCSYLKLTIKTADFKDLEFLRNNAGGKYYACEFCGEDCDEQQVYITDYGDRYHSDRNCRGLKRGILKVLLEDVGDLALCSRCGENNE